VCDAKGHMRHAVDLSRQKMDEGCGGPFGAIIVCNGEVIAEGWNNVTSQNDPTAHAEVSAIRAACAKLGTFNLSGCEIYTSCEPCPMCLSAIYWARLDKIYYANGAKMLLPSDLMISFCMMRWQSRSKIVHCQLCMSICPKRAKCLPPGMPKPTRSNIETV